MKPTAKLVTLFSILRTELFDRRAIVATSLCFSLCVAQSLFGQGTISDNFNDGTDTGTQGAWTHYAPLQTTPWNEQVSWTFPPDGSGGFGYRIFGGVPNISNDPASGQNTGPARVGSFRNDATYSDQFTAVDFFNWNDRIPENAGFMGVDINTPGFLTTSGYLFSYTSALDWRDQQGIFAIVEFQTELTVSSPNEFQGGANLVSRLDPTKKYRMVGTILSNNFAGAIYSSTDLLEPIVKIGAANSDIPTGTSGLGAVSYNTDDDKITGFTFDNYYSSPRPTDPIGFPGTPQVVNLNPAPQTLFYQPPNNGSNITFTITTFTSNPIDTNAMRMSLNGSDVTAQLALFERRDILVGSPHTNFFVVFTGPLSTNTIYNGQIKVVDMSGAGTTNNFVFDTFANNGNLVVEAEDYNFGGGQFIDNPLVSGLQPDGTEKGFSTNYYNQTGSPDIDYHNTATGLSVDNNQYRPADYVGTAQGVYAGDTPRPDHVAANVPDYYLWRLQAGDWQNYTRTFPNNNWKVYVRVSSQDAQAVRFDEVTSDRAQPNQTTVLHGNFLVPNTGSSTRFRHIPLTDAFGNPIVLAFSGVHTFRSTPLGGFDSNRQHGQDDNGSFQPTYFLFLPTANAAPTTPFVALVSPAPNTTDASVQSAVQAIILNRTTSVNLSSIHLSFDGTDVTGSSTITGSTTEGPGATVTYNPPGFLLPNSAHTINLSFSDGTTSQSNQWSFTVGNTPLVPASFALASAPSTNFSVQVHKAPNTSEFSNSAADQPEVALNSTWRAERQLANQLIQPSTLAPYTNEAANTGTNYGWYVEPLAIDYEECGNPDPNYFTNNVNFPGIYPSNWCGTASTEGVPQHFAIAATIQVPLSAGVYRMGVLSDDGFKVTASTNIVTLWTNAPQTEVQLGIYDGGRGASETAFDFVVAANGVYNFRLLYFQGEGGSECEWYWIDRTTGIRTLVEPAQPLQLLSAATVKGPYSAESTAQIDTNAKTITVPKSGSTRFYRLVSTTTAYKLGRPVLSGNNVIMTYQ